MQASHQYGTNLSSGYLAPAAASAGDVNGDGFDDVVVSALAADVNGQASGSTFVVFGKASGFAAKLSLGALTGANGFRINGATAGDLRVRES